MSFGTAESVLTLLSGLLKIQKALTLLGPIIKPNKSDYGWTVLLQAFEFKYLREFFEVISQNILGCETVAQGRV